MKVKYKGFNEPADIDVTSFMNLMIVLVPVLLMTMAFTQTAVLEIKLPELTGGAALTQDPQAKLEIEITDEGYRIFYPETTMIQQIPLIEGEEGMTYDQQALSEFLQYLKRENPEKRDVLLRSQRDIVYQDIVRTMDTMKSYRTVIAASVVEIELFPEISLDDARKKAK
ncbi:hypothetical protein TDB9533_04194 [Thalassocella blandensis]|nr:hypothetical protein TDB9533_04194 [Thalassocella blandensis]